MSRQLNKTKQDILTSNIIYEDEIKKLTTFRDLLDIELNEIIMKKLNQHAVCLNKEKENRLFQFDTHVDQYSRTQLSRLYWK